MTEIVPSVPPLSAHLPSQRDFWGHPQGLWVLVITEAWVAFSLYGMQALLVLYMKDSVLQPDHVGHVWGFCALKRLIEALYAPVGIPALAGAIMGLFLALLFATPLLGGVVADRLLGRTKTVVLGAVCMTLGHFLMAFDASFVIAIVCLLVGQGFIGSLRAQVGALYTLNDGRRSDAYQLYTLGVQVAVIVSPALCASLGKINWHWGFLAAGMGMAIGLACYLKGLDRLPPEPLRVRHEKRPSLTRVEKKAVFLLLCLVFVLAFGSLPNNEIFDGYLLWGEQHYSLSLFGWSFPVSYLLSLDGLISSITAIAVLWFWKIYTVKYSDPSEITKVAIGTAICTFSPLFLIAGVWFGPGLHQVNLLWGIAFHTVNDIGYAMIYAIGAALFSRAAPVSLNTIMVACFSLNVFVSNLIVGKLSTLVTEMSSTAFWLLHAGLAGCAAIILGLFAYFFRKELAPEVPAAP